MPDFIPRSDADVYNFAKAFVGHVCAEPGAYGVDPAQSADMQEKFSLFVDQYREATSPQTRTAPALIGKDEARAVMIDAIRSVTKIIRATPTNTPGKLAMIGLRPRAPRVRVIHPPEAAPFVSIRGTTGSVVHVRISDAETPRIAKPKGAFMAVIYSHVGEEAPASLRDWKMETRATRTTFDILFDRGIQPGAKVWLCAQWSSRRYKHGPVSAAVSTHVAYPSMTLAA